MASLLNCFLDQSEQQMQHSSIVSQMPLQKFGQNSAAILVLQGGNWQLRGTCKSLQPARSRKLFLSGCQWHPVSDAFQMVCFFHSNKQVQLNCSYFCINIFSLTPKMFSAFLSSNSLTLMEKLVTKPGEVNYRLKSGDMKSQGHTQTKLG